MTEYQKVASAIDALTKLQIKHQDISFFYEKYHRNLERMIISEIEIKFAETFPCRGIPEIKCDINCPAYRMCTKIYLRTKRLVNSQYWANILSIPEFRDALSSAYRSAREQ